MATPTFVPGHYHAGGWDIDGNGTIDMTVPEAMRSMVQKRPRGQEVKTLNQYTGYFTSDEGDYPVSVVANSIKEAAKILTMPGVFGADSAEPTMIKFVKSSIAVSVPVHQVGFNTIITPDEAVDAGATATPTHAEVQNGTDVIFTATEPFGWNFVGWYKGDPGNGGTQISTSKVTTVDVYDAYSTLVDYYAKYEFNPVIRNGRYMDVSRGWIWDFDFDGYSNYAGRLVLTGPTTGDCYFVITELSLNESGGESTATITTDTSITQPLSMSFAIKFSPTYIGLEAIVTNATQDNSLGFITDKVFELKYVGSSRYEGASSKVTQN